MFNNANIQYGAVAEQHCYGFGNQSYMTSGTDSGRIFSSFQVPHGTFPQATFNQPSFAPEQHFPPSPFAAMQTPSHVQFDNAWTVGQNNGHSPPPEGAPSRLRDLYRSSRHTSPPASPRTTPAFMPGTPSPIGSPVKTGLYSATSAPPSPVPFPGFSPPTASAANIWKAVDETELSSLYHSYDSPSMPSVAPRSLPQQQPTPPAPTYPVYATQPQPVAQPLWRSQPVPSPVRNPYTQPYSPAPSSTGMDHDQSASTHCYPGTTGPAPIGPGYFIPRDHPAHAGPQPPHPPVAPAPAQPLPQAIDAPSAYGRSPQVFLEDVIQASRPASSTQKSGYVPATSSAPMDIDPTPRGPMRVRVRAHGATNFQHQHQFSRRSAAQAEYQQATACY